MSSLTGAALKGVEKFGGQIWNGISSLGSDVGEGADAFGEWAGSDAAPAIGEGLSDVAPVAEVAVAAKGGKVKMAAGGKVPALVSPGEGRLHRKDVSKVAAGADPLKLAKKIPGKPKVGGAKNSYANDTVPMTLNEGDIILPRSVTQSKHPHWAAHKFVSAIMAQKRGKK
jgi:hypothetical protein